MAYLEKNVDELLEQLRANMSDPQLREVACALVQTERQQLLDTNLHLPCIVRLFTFKQLCAAGISARLAALLKLAFPSPAAPAAPAAPAVPAAPAAPAPAPAAPAIPANPSCTARSMADSEVSFDELVAGLKAIPDKQLREKACELVEEERGQLQAGYLHIPGFVRAATFRQLHEGAGISRTLAVALKVAFPSPGDDTARIAQQLAEFNKRMEPYENVEVPTKASHTPSLWQRIFGGDRPEDDADKKLV